MLANRNAASTIQRVCIGRWFLQRATPGWRADAAVSAAPTAASARRSSVCSHRSGGAQARPAPPHSAFGPSFIQGIPHGPAVPLVKPLLSVFYRALMRADLIVPARQHGQATRLPALTDPVFL